ncbi:MAG: BlaI/MecI/CopY family transcriptional regulator [Peptococcaceae bacterium]|jgi:BlaI family penicillinase repressor|nr:BlaI/MecI/CopY family transcriptional regulator [Peptococcaceae bacterium]
MSTKIANAELEIMRILWREGRPLSFAQLREELANRKGWNKSTTQTLILRLRKKDIVSADFGDTVMYSPNISEQEFLEAEEQNFLNKLFDGNAKSFVSALCRNGKLNKNDISEFMSMFEEDDDTK